MLRSFPPREIYVTLRYSALCSKSGIFAKFIHLHLEKLDAFVDFRRDKIVGMKDGWWKRNGIAKQCTSISSNTVTSHAAVTRRGHNGGLHWKRFVRDKSASPAPAVLFVAASLSIRCKQITYRAYNHGNSARGARERFRKMRHSCVPR